MRFSLVAPAVVIASSASSSAFAVDYLTADQAARLMFATADSFDASPVVLTIEQQALLEAQGMKRWPKTVQARTARRAGATLGHVVTDSVIGRSELIDYAVGLSLDGKITQVEILSYRESHGAEIRLSSWRRQFVGREASASMRVGEEIANISGATLSCTHVTDGIHRIVAVMAMATRLQGGSKVNAR
ncbi:MAG: FMN-binding protein [Rhizobacter sp.]|nr:FMN-binding protein [Rhizobacter sp.]